MQVLQRLTVSVSDPSVLHILVNLFSRIKVPHSIKGFHYLGTFFLAQASPNVDSYDLLAICPGSEKVLQV